MLLFCAAFLFDLKGMHGAELVLSHLTKDRKTEQTGESRQGEISKLIVDYRLLADVIENKRRFYLDTFPSLEFVVLQGGDAWPDEIIALSVLLGHEPVNLDYEHPPDAREDLMYVSLERIRLMLESNTPSATLFLSDEPMGWREKLCVLTINPVEIAANDQTATHYLIEPYYEIRGKIKPQNYLDRREFVEFVFDHEVYHCLESNFIGPQPMSFLEFWGEYHHYRHENGADAFAVAMHMKRHGAVTDFVKNINLIRALTLFCDDCNHWTPEIITKVSNTEMKLLQTMDTAEIFRYATSLRNIIVPNYSDYLVYRSAAKEVCAQINSDLWNLGDEENLPEPDPKMVTDMLDTFRRSYFELTGNEID